MTPSTETQRIITAALKVAGSDNFIPQVRFAFELFANTIREAARPASGEKDFRDVGLAALESLAPAAPAPAATAPMCQHEWGELSNAGLRRCRLNGGCGSSKDEYSGRTFWTAGTITETPGPQPVSTSARAAEGGQTPATGHGDKVVMPSATPAPLPDAAHVPAMKMLCDHTDAWEEHGSLARCRRCGQEAEWSPVRQPPADAAQGKPKSFGHALDCAMFMGGPCSCDSQFLTGTSTGESGLSTLNELQPLNAGTDKGAGYVSVTASLKTCPFCDAVPRDNSSRFVESVRCINPACAIKPHVIGEGATTAWNTRYTPRAGEGDVYEALSKLLDHIKRIPYRDAANMRLGETNPFIERAYSAIAGRRVGTEGARNE